MKYIILLTELIFSTSNSCMENSLSTKIIEKEINKKDITNNPFILFNKNYLPQFTQSLCASHNYKPSEIRTTIRTLSDTNKSLHNYYAQEKNQQDVIDLCVMQNHSDCRTMASALGLHTIHKKISRFFNIIMWDKDVFTEADKRETWYLNMTVENGTLLYNAIKLHQLEEALFIINNVSKLHFCYDDNQNILKEIAISRHCCRLIAPKTTCQLLGIAQLLLKKGILPDGRTDKTQLTPLMIAGSYKDRAFAYQLLLHGADPYETHFDAYNLKIYNNIFYYAPKGWLLEIMGQIEAQGGRKLRTFS
jgi:hypothetical protein